MITFFLASEAGAEPRARPSGRSISLEAERVELDLRRGGARAFDARLGFCGECGAPWTLGARRVDVYRNGDVDFLLPVLRIGPVPLLALPWLRLRTGRHFGLLLPRVALRSFGGFEVGQGVWIPLSPGAEMVLFASFLSGIRGAELFGSVETDSLALRARGTFAPDVVAASVEGNGAARWRRTSLVFDLDWTHDGEISRRLSLSVEQQARAFEVSRFAIIHGSEHLQVAAAADVAHDLSPQPQHDAYRVRARLLMDLLPVPVGPVSIRMRASQQVAWSGGRGSWPAFRTDVLPELFLPMSFGPLSASFSVAGFGATHGPSGRAVAVGSANLSLPLQRAFRPSLVHRLTPGVSYKLAFADVLGGNAPMIWSEPGTWPLAGHSLWLRLQTRVYNPSTGSGVAIRLQQHVALPQVSATATEHFLRARVELRTGPLGAATELTLDERRLDLSHMSAELRVEGRVGGSVLWHWFRESSSALAMPDPDDTIPLLVPWSFAGSQGVHAALWWAITSEVQLRAEGQVDLDSGALLRGGGAVRYSHRCGCLSAALQVWYRRGRAVPDTFLTLGLGGLE